MVLFQKCVLWFGPSTKMAPTVELSLTYRTLLEINITIFSSETNCNQTLVESSLHGPLPNLCPVIPTFNQNGWQAKNRKKGGMKFKKNVLLWNYCANLNQTLLKWSLGGSLPKLCPVILTFNQDGRQARNRNKGDEILKKSSPLKLLSQSQPNFAEMILRWSPSKIESGISDLRPRWPP